jgi:small-conductance mechanosensitive channel
MEPELQAIAQQGGAIWDSVWAQIRNLTLPSRYNQIIILLIGLGLAWLARRWAGHHIREWLRDRTGWPKWRLRALIIIEQRLGFIIFVVYTWSATAIMRTVSPFPSRSFLLELVATMATAIMLVSFAARLVKNRTLRKVLTWGLWIYVILFYLNLVAPMAEFLDSLGVQFGDFRLSALSILKALIVTALLLTLARMAAQASASRVRANEDISPSMQVLVVKVLQIGFYSAAFFIGLKAVGFDLTGLAVLSGAIGLGLGFGLQKVVSNLVSGVIILLDKSIKPGDVISLGETFGWVETLTARYVSITTRDGREFLIPNEDLITGQVVNWSHSNDFVRLDIHFGTAYGDDPHDVRRIAIEAAKGCDRVLSVRPPVCHIVGFGDSSVDYVLRFWIRDPTEGLTNIRGNVYLALWDAFKENDISIPFPQREVRMLADDGPAVAD